MEDFAAQLAGVKTAAIAGHIRPDGDCVGSCLATYNYIRQNFPKIHVDLYLEPIPNIFKFLPKSEEIRNSCEEDRVYDLFIAQDCGDAERLGEAAKYFRTAKKTICVDHHISNDSFADENYIYPHASSTSELVFELIGREHVTRDIAACIYVGIVHDTGVFQYSCTSAKTMEIAGKLMETGIDFSDIVDKTYVQKTYEQNHILARAIEKSSLHLGGTCISSIITLEDMESCHVLPKHLEGIVAQMRSTKGVEAAVFFYQKDENEYKISMRSSSDAVNVAEIAMHYGGGGHMRAAGASTTLEPKECLAQILELIENQMKKQQAG